MSAAIASSSENSGAWRREIKRRSRVVQVFPSTASLVPLAGAVMCELYDENCMLGIDGTVDWARPGAEAIKMIGSGLELADRIKTA